MPEATQEVVFSHDGLRVGIDLCSTHHKEFMRVWKAMEEYTEAARAVRVNKPNTVGRQHQARKGRLAHNVGTSVKNAKVREWANRNGYEVASRGTIPGDIYRAYEEATHGVDLASV